MKKSGKDRAAKKVTKGSKKVTKGSRKARLSYAPASTPPQESYAGSWFPPAEAFATYFRLETDKLVELHERVVEELAASKADFDKKWKELAATQEWDDEVADWLADDAFALDQQHRWSTLLQVVALYHCLEKEIGTLFAWRFSGLPEEEAEKLMFKVHKWKELKTLLHAWCGSASLEAVSKYDEVDDLRLLCNCVKHTGGTVSREWAEKKGLPRGDNLDHTRIDVHVLREAAITFLQDLVTRAEAGVVATLGKPPS